MVNFLARSPRIIILLRDARKGKFADNAARDLRVNSDIIFNFLYQPPSVNNMIVKIYL